MSPCSPRKGDRETRGERPIRRRESWPRAGTGTRGPLTQRLGLSPGWQGCVAHLYSQVGISDAGTEDGGERQAVLPALANGPPTRRRGRKSVLKALTSA